MNKLITEIIQHEPQFEEFLADGTEPSLYAMVLVCYASHFPIKEARKYADRYFKQLVTELELETIKR